MNGPEIEFDWDEANVGHAARHQVRPEEAEQVILNNPVDLGLDVVHGEERYLNLGATDQGRVLLVVTTWRDHRVRVITAFEPMSRLIQLYFEERGGDLPWPGRNYRGSILRRRKPRGGRSPKN